jgi:hypothetical protein
LTWGIRLAELNNEKLNPEVYEKAKKSMDFLYKSMDISSGMLPNYGSNDGALFFKLNDQDYRDFRPQIQALLYALDLQGKAGFQRFIGEDLYWLGLARKIPENYHLNKDIGTFSYPAGGYYIIREKNSMTYIRCGKHKDRPAHADNLHLDIWYKGINYFRDNGSYMYNSETELLRFFFGTLSHNTVMLDDFDQMLKGPRFIWFDWSQAKNAAIKESDDYYEFEGTVSAFRYLGKAIEHRRNIIKVKGTPRWIVTDEITGTNKYRIHQLWHPDPDVSGLISVIAHDSGGKVISKEIRKGWYSSYYGQKEETDYWIFSTDSRKIVTEIEIPE